MDQIFTGEHSGVGSAGMPRQGIFIKNSKRFIFPHATPATTKHRMVTQVERLPLIKSHISLLMRSCDST